MTSTPSTRPATSQFRFMMALQQGLVTSLITLALFVFIIGLRVDLNIRNELQLWPQYGYLLNYVLIAALGRFTWSYCGGGARGILYALVPAVTLFIGYRAWLYYTDATAKGTYVFSAQSLQLALIALVLAALFALAGLFIFSSSARQTASRMITALQPAARRFGPGLTLLFLLVYPLLVITLLTDTMAQTQKWIDNYAIQILIYVMLAWGLNIVVGFAGLLDLGYVAFYAVGAYTVAILGNEFGFSFWICLPVAGLLAAFFGLMLGFPVLRLRGDYLAIVTLAFGEIIRLVLQNWHSVTGGTRGLEARAQRPTFFGHPFDRSADGFAKFFGLKFEAAHYKIFLYYVLVMLLVAMAVIIIRLRRLPIGRVWEALREDEIACRALGINTVMVKLSAFATGAMFGGIAGAFFTARQGRVDFSSFTFMESIIILAIVVLGGMGSLTGIAIASIIMIGGQELLTRIGVLPMIFGPDFEPQHYRMLWFGLVMVFVMIIRPRGLASNRMPSAFLHKRKAISGAFISEGNA
ncbi:MAG: Branched-chain amino acid transporter protein [Candidatus Tokpelaia hoelldobleri]|uniref:Branched-chain amino acid transporter protein n=1 Tax=Candidatus Tokpelaia hoelldobleri TaxID=1902579 RepID=A0A1U9JWG2_9HYPH|nr:MAG: Branched-chain amino acid transporter protein [Candidatus Tokpelaia hoelldoblerii]